MISLSFWPIAVAALANFAIGSIWYSPILFGKEWMELSGIKSDEAPKGVWKLYAVQLIATVITFIILGFAISLGGNKTASAGASIGFFAWIGFVAPIGISNLLWEKKPARLILINTVYYLLAFVVGGAIIGAWN